YTYVRSNPLGFIDPSGLSREDMRFIYEQVKSQFPEINPVWPAGDIDLRGSFLDRLQGNAAEATTNIITGTIYVPSTYGQQSCLPFSEWEHVFFRLIFHESMHSKDWPWKRPDWILGKEDLIVNRVNVEARAPSLPPLNVPTWGTPRRNRVDTNALYRQYLAN